MINIWLFVSLFHLYIRSNADIWRYWINRNTYQKCCNWWRFGWGWLACIQYLAEFCIQCDCLHACVLMQTVLFIIKLLIITNTRGIVRKILGPSVCTQSFDNLASEIRNEYSYCTDHDIVLVPLRSAMQWSLMVNVIAKINAVCMWTSLIWFHACSRLCTSWRSYTSMHHFSNMMKQAILSSKYCKLHELSTNFISPS